MTLKRSPRLALVAAAAAVAVATLAPSGAGSMRSQHAQSVTVAIIPVDATMQAAYAQARGFFAKQGVDAKITVITDPTQLPAAILSGDAQFASFNVGGAATLKSRGFPLRVVASGAIYEPKRPSTYIVTSPHATIAHASDLIGKTIAIDAHNTIGHIGLLKWLKGRGISADQVKLTELPFPEMLGPLSRGQVDAAILPEPFLTLALRQGARRLAPYFNAVCSTDCLGTVFIARKDVDPQLAARFRNAIQAAGAWADLKRNRAASGAILEKYTPIDATVLATMTRISYATRLRVALAQPWIDAYAEFGVIPDSFPAIELVR